MVGIIGKVVRESKLRDFFFFLIIKLTTVSETFSISKHSSPLVAYYSILGI